MFCGVFGEVLDFLGCLLGWVRVSWCCGVDWGLGLIFIGVLGVLGGLLFSFFVFLGWV